MEQEENGFYGYLGAEFYSYPQEEQEQTTPPLTPDRSPCVRSIRPNLKWSKKLQQRVKEQILNEQKRIARFAAKRDPKARRIRKKCETLWVWDAIEDNPRWDGIRFRVKMNFHREGNQYMLKTLECLVRDAIRFPETREIVKTSQYGLGRIQVPITRDNKRP